MILSSRSRAMSSRVDMAADSRRGASGPGDRGISLFWLNTP
jgi:hypothetical protein